MPKMAHRTHRIIHLAKTGHQSIPMGTMVIPEITQRAQMRLTGVRVEMVLETEMVEMRIRRQPAILQGPVCRACEVQVVAKKIQLNVTHR